MVYIKTYNEIYLAARRTLSEHGIEAFDIEARLLAAKASGKTQEKFLQESRFYVTDDTFENAMQELVARRLKGEPVAYLTGEWEFYSLPIAVTGDVLIPRVDTEVLAEQAIGLLKTSDAPMRCLDLCTGSGCVGLAIAANTENVRVVLCDKSPKALAVARQNTLKNNLSRRMTCVEADVELAPPAILGKFDMIVCNPPYIPSGDIAGLDASVREYEPLMALDGGVDGLYFYRLITENWRTVLKPDGWLLYECGIGQAQDVAEILKRSGFDDVNIVADTAGIERVVYGRKTE